MVAKARAVLEWLAGVAHHVAGLLALALIVVGVWGIAGWEWAAVVAGSPFAAFYLYGQAREAAREPGMGE